CGGKERFKLAIQLMQPHLRTADQISRAAEHKRGEIHDPEHVVHLVCLPETGRGPRERAPDEADDPGHEWEADTEEDARQYIARNAGGRHGAPPREHFQANAWFRPYSYAAC